jgi:hypothetical protein
MTIQGTGAEFPWSIETHTLERVVQLAQVVRNQ